MDSRSEKNGRHNGNDYHFRGENLLNIYCKQSSIKHIAGIGIRENKYKKGE